MTLSRWEQNRQHWNETLDARNLDSDARSDFLREVALYKTKDVRDGLDFLEPIYERWVLDLGGGLGQASYLFLQRGGRVVICDISIKRCIEAKRVLNGLGFGGRFECVVASSDQLPFADESMGRIWTKSVLIHTRLPETAGECARVISKEDGAIWMIEPTPNNPFVNLYRRYFAPKVWQHITDYFRDDDFDLLQKEFLRSAKSPSGKTITVRRHYFLLGFFATAFSFVLSVPIAYRIMEAILTRLDSILFWFSRRLRQRCWFGVLGMKFNRRTRRP